MRQNPQNRIKVLSIKHLTHRHHIITSSHHHIIITSSHHMYMYMYARMMRARAI